MTQYKRRTDANQQTIIDALTEEYGPGSVVALHRAGEGVPDLLFGYDGVNLLLEVKTEAGKLTPAQRRWHSNWHGQVAVVRSADEAMQAIKKRMTDD